MDMRSPRESEQSEKKRVECSGMKGQVTDRDPDIRARAMGRNSMTDSAADSGDETALRENTVKCHRKTKQGQNHAQRSKTEAQVDIGGCCLPNSQSLCLGSNSQKADPETGLCRGDSWREHSRRRGVRWRREQVRKAECGLSWGLASA